MLFILNKNKIISYIIASSVVIGLFLLSISIVPNQNVELIQISSNIANNSIHNEVNNIEDVHKNNLITTEQLSKKRKTGKI